MRIRNIILGIVGIITLVGVFALVGNLIGTRDVETKEISPTFSVGGLSEQGKYLETETSIYTKEAFECQGLDVKLEFDNTIDYQVFFYESDGDFISSTDVLSGNAKMDVPTMATHARIQVMPNWNEMGEDYEDEENQVIKWYEVSKYADQINIRVNKVQEELLILNYLGEDYVVVDSINDVQFVENCLTLGADGSIGYRENAKGYAMHQNYLIKVKGGETINFNNTLGVSGLSYAVVELYSDDLQVNPSSPKFGWKTDATYTIDTNTDYVIINVKGTDGTSLTAEQLSRLYTCFNIVK